VKCLNVLERQSESYSTVKWLVMTLLVPTAKNRHFVNKNGCLPPLNPSSIAD
jgi:hypothetical protein